MKKSVLLVSVCALAICCTHRYRATDAAYQGSVNTNNYTNSELPPPNSTKSTKNFSKVVGWPGALTPTAPTGFTVTKFAAGFDHPRWMYVADNGDLFVAESNTILKGINKIGSKLSRKIRTQHYGTSANRVTLLRDRDKDGVYETNRAAIWEVNPDGSSMRIYASGLRNPVGLDWAPGTHTLWAAVNERDELGDELVPDYITGVKEGGFYGWPYSYYGQHEDPRMKDKQRPDLVSKAIVPDVPLGSHTASLGMVFYDKNAFPSKYQNGAFVAQHGSWNRSVLSGYRVIFVPFKNGKPSGPPEDFLTGFIADLERTEVHGRPVGLALLPDGSMLVSDDSSNTIWKVDTVK